MKRNNDSKNEYQPSFQLDLLKSKSKKIAPSLYKAHALYLECFRTIISDAIKASYFYILAENSKKRSSLPSGEIRSKFLLQIQNIISDNISVLTVEHLLNLADTIEKEKKLQLKNAKDEMFNALKKTKESQEDVDNLFDHSINLSISPQLERNFIFEGWEGEIEGSCSFLMEDKYQTAFLESDIYSSDDQRDVETLSEDFNEEDAEGNLERKRNVIDIFQSFFVMEEKDGELTSGDKTSEHNLSKDNLDLTKKESNTFLPDSPLGLLEWVESLDSALTRRLRNISHSINIELLRHGFVNTLVPVNLLDSIIDGHIPSNSSISNIVSLNLPLNSGLASEGIDIECILLRQSDLEFDHSHLRKCKLHIKQYRYEILRMVKQQRYWQSRSLADELRQQWWQSSPKT